MYRSACVGIRDLKNGASAIVRRVRQGETITVTDRNRPVAVLVPLGAPSGAAAIREVVKTGRVAWAGGKPRGARRPPVVRGPSVSDAVVEDRR